MNDPNNTSEEETNKPDSPPESLPEESNYGLAEDSILQYFDETTSLN